MPAIIPTGMFNSGIDILTAFSYVFQNDRILDSKKSFYEQGKTPMTHETPVDSNAMITPKRSLRFKIGVFLLIVNTPIGYGGSALAAAIGLKTRHPALGAGIALGIYILSWNMLGLGIWMAGPEGLKLVKDLHRNWFKTRKAPSGTANDSA